VRNAAREKTVTKLLWEAEVKEQSVWLIVSILGAGKRFAAMSSERYL
jgi:hypothetical protein